jgi:hypothetical protein
MDDAMAVRVVERGGDFLRKAHGLVHGELALALQAIAEALALDEWHHIEEEAVRLPRIEEREDVRILERRRRLDLRQEALGADDRGKLGAKHLHRDLAIVAQVVGEVDRRHSAGAELALETIPIDERFGETWRNLVHE